MLVYGHNYTDNFHVRGDTIHTCLIFSFWILLFTVFHRYFKEKQILSQERESSAVKGVCCSSRGPVNVH